MDGEKVPWRGALLAVQPHIRLTRPFDQRHHWYLGYVLFLRGAVAGEAREFSRSGSGNRSRRGTRFASATRFRGAYVANSFALRAPQALNSGLQVNVDVGMFF